MTALPAASAWSGTAVTEGGFKAAQNDLRAYLAALLGTDGAVATALATLGSLLGAGVVTKSSNYTVVAGDRGKLLSCSGTITINLLAAATAGSGFAVVVKNSGSGTVTIDANLTETIEGAETLALSANASALLVCDGSGWIKPLRFDSVDLVSGVLAAARVGTGTPDGTRFLRDDMSWQTVQTTPTTAQVLSALTGLSLGAVGTFAELVYTSAGTISPGGTTSGSNLRYGCGDGSYASSPTPSGTWRCLGYGKNTNSTLWLRIS